MLKWCYLYSNEYKINLSFKNSKVFSAYEQKN